jgi:hypothetical protein
MKMNEVNLSSVTDCPTDQHVDALNKFDENKCDVCGGPDGNIWMHSDSWTQWLRYGCGCNVMHCQKPECAKGAEVIRRSKIAENRIKAEEYERETLRNIQPEQLSRIRYRYHDAFNCGDHFRDWVKSVVGEEKMKEYLDVACDNCNKLIEPPRYKFQDKDGHNHLWMVDEIKDYCYEVTGRNKNDSPFLHDKENDCSEIEFKTILWDYYERKGWEHNRKDHTSPEEAERFDEAFRATNEDEWAYGQFIYYMPTKTFLGKKSRRGGDLIQVVQSNREQLEKEQEELDRSMGKDKYNNPSFWTEYKAIEKKKTWSYFCGEDCRAKSTNQKGMLFI